MPKFFYKAIDESGGTVSGEIQADSIEMVNNILSTRGYIPSQVTDERSVSAGISLKNIMAKFTPIKAPELILFTKQLKTMLRSGVPMMKILEILESQTENLNIKKIVSSMSQDIQEGSSLYDAFKKHPRAFSALYCSMVRAGEESGALPDVLERLIYIIEHEHKIKSDVKSALQYPIIVVIFLFVAFFILLTFVVPKFIGIFNKAGLDIPLPTQICLFMYNFLNHYWIWCTSLPYIIHDISAK